MTQRCLGCHAETDGKICAACEWALSGREIPRIEYYDELEAEAAALRERVKELEQFQADDTSTNDKLRTHKLILKTALQAIIDDYERDGRGIQYMADTAKEALWKIDKDTL